MAPLVLMAAVWALGWAMGLSARWRLLGVALVWAVTVIAHLLLPPGHGLRLWLGGTAAGWMVLGGGAALALAYRAGLRGLRAHARPAAPPPAATPAPQVPAPADGPFAEGELARYARHILLREIGGPGQMRLKSARVLVVGAGGLGSPVLLYLAAAGVGQIAVVDGDVVEVSNLQRQIIHDENRLGMEKVRSAAAAIQALNPFVMVETHAEPLTGANAAALIAGRDLVLDGTDNFDTRYLVNRICAEAGVPLISGAITQWEGQLSLFDPARGAPCYECVFPERPLPGMVPTCAEAGVAAPLPGILGAMMAMEAIKHLTGAGETLRGRLMIHDALYAETRVINVMPRADCPACAGLRRA